MIKEIADKYKNNPRFLALEKGDTEFGLRTILNWLRLRKWQEPEFSFEEFAKIKSYTFVKRFFVLLSGVMVLSVLIGAFLVYTTNIFPVSEKVQISEVGRSVSQKLPARSDLSSKSIEKKHASGSYAMWGTEDPLSSNVLNNKGIVGILLGVSWQDIEKNDGNYDWSKLDAQISQIRKSGLTVALKIVASPREAPDWLKNDSIGLQMLSAASLCNKDSCRINNGNFQCEPANDPECVLQESIAIGLSYKPRFIEFWQADAENQQLQDVFKSAEDALKSY